VSGLIAGFSAYGIVESPELLFFSSSTAIGLYSAAGLRQIEIPGLTANLLQLAWSPDGSKFAYLRSPGADQREREVRVMNADGTGDVLIATGEYDKPTWSPDGSKILVVKNGFSGFDILRSSGGRLPIDFPDIQANPEWSPDGSRIVFVGGSTGPCAGGFCLVNADGTNLEFIFDGYWVRAGGCDCQHQFLWSPDGGRIAFFGAPWDGSTTSAIYVLRLADGLVTKVTFSRYPGFDENLDLNMVGWSPDPANDQILFARQQWDDFGLYLANADGTGERQLYAPAQNLGQYFKADWSPDGRRVVWDEDGLIRIINVDGSGLQSLGLSYGSSPRWRP
jgi:Tol biopolymer transport system component